MKLINHNATAGNQPGQRNSNQLLIHHNPPELVSSSSFVEEPQLSTWEEFVLPLLSSRASGIWDARSWFADKLVGYE